MGSQADRYVLYADKAGETRWKRVARNGRTVADSGEGYTKFGQAVAAVLRLDSNAEIVVRARGRLLPLATYEDTR